MHMRKVCQYGFTHTQCRCPSPDKKIITINCDMPIAHAPKKPALEEILPPGMPSEEYFSPIYERDDLPTRLDNVLEHHLWWMKDDARMALVRDLMEQINQT